VPSGTEVYWQAYLYLPRDTDIDAELSQPCVLLVLAPLAANRWRGRSTAGPSINRTLYVMSLSPTIYAAALILAVAMGFLTIENGASAQARYRTADEAVAALINVARAGSPALLVGGAGSGQRRLRSILTGSVRGSAMRSKHRRPCGSST